jgi:hypothetical protein
MIDGRIVEDLEGSGSDLILVLSQNLPRRTDKKAWKTAVRIAGVLAEIRTEHPPNPSQQLYR